MILLTGASGGIGEELFFNLSKIDKVIGIYNKKKPKTKKIANGLLVKVDLSSSKNIANFVKKYEKKLKNITLIHCAAVKIDSLLAQFQEKDFDKIINLNIKANFLITKALLPIMIKNNWGRIIHISSVSGFQGAVGTIPYGLSKTSLIGLSRGLSKEYAKFNITSNILDLGYFKNGLYNKLPEIIKKQLISQIPSKKLGNIKNIVNAIHFLMKSEYVNGAKINIDGGI